MAGLFKPLSCSMQAGEPAKDPPVSAGPSSLGWPVGVAGRVVVGVG